METKKLLRHANINVRLHVESRTHRRFAMRHFVTTSLIVCGTLLALAPFVSDTLQGWRIADALAGRVADSPFGFFRQPLDELYLVGAWVIGGAMITVGIVQAVARCTSAPNNDLSTNAPQHSC
jgi:hypothetical protein